MKKKLSWAVILAIGIVCWFLSRAIGGVVGSSIGLLADILILVGVITGIVEAVKKHKSKTNL